MTATEELRKLLDERGVEWQGCNEFTFFNGWMAKGFYSLTLESTKFLSSEQVIEATLGRGTCYNVCGEDKRADKERRDPSRFLCSECGWEDWDMYTYSDEIRFCPYCGRSIEVNK